jgi:hypothetical protein
MAENSPISTTRIEGTILHIRGEKVMLDADLAAFYGVATRRRVEAVKRNRERFPDDFMFQLTGEMNAEVVANCDRLARLSAPGAGNILDGRSRAWISCTRATR